MRTGHSGERRAGDDGRGAGRDAVWTFPWSRDGNPLMDVGRPRAPSDRPFHFFPEKKSKQDLCTYLRQTWFGPGPLPGTSLTREVRLPPLAPRGALRGSAPLGHLCPSPPRAATCPSAAPNPAAGSVWPSLARSLTRPTWPWPLPAASPAACHTEIFLGHVCRCVHPTLSWDESRALDRVKYFEIKATCAYVRVGIYLLKCSKRRPKGCTLDLKCKRVSPCRVEPPAALHGCPRWENLSGGTFSFLFIHFCIVRIFFFYHEYILHFYNQEEL